MMSTLRSRRAQAMRLDKVDWQTIRDAERPLLRELGIRRVLDWEAVDRFLDDLVRQVEATYIDLPEEASWDAIELDRVERRRVEQAYARELGLAAETTGDDIEDRFAELDEATLEDLFAREKRGEFGVRSYYRDKQEKRWFFAVD